MLRIGLGVILAAFVVIEAANAEDPSDDVVSGKHGLSNTDIVRLRNYRGLTNANLLEMSTQRVRRVLWRLDNPKPDQPMGAAEYRLLQQAGSADVEIPENALGRAVERVQSMRSAITAPATRSASARSFSPPATARAPGLSGGVSAEVVSVAGIPVGTIGEQRGPAPGAAPRAAAPRAPGAAAVADPRRGMLDLQLEALAAPEVARTRAAAPLPPGGMTPKRWKWLGPGNIGGRTRAIVVHPTQPEIMWLGAAAGGIWKTVDGGSSWAPLADFMANLNVSTLALDPDNPDILFAGTGEGFFNLDAFRGAGLFRSIDGGATWGQLSATASSQFQFVNRIAITADGSTMLIGTRSGLFRSTSYREEDPGRVTFAAAAGLDKRDILDVRCDPVSAERCVAGGRGNTIHVTTSKGAEWTAARGLPAAVAGDTFGGRVELTYARANPSTVYASIDVNGGELWRSTDGGATFALRNTGRNILSGQGWYDNAIWAGDPQRADLVIVGGVDLYRSTDGGQTLTQISEWWKAPNSAHADHHTIVAHPRYDGVSNRIAFFGNDGGIYRNDDVLTAAPLTGWQALNNNYGVTQFYGAAISPQSGRLVGGTQDNGTIVYRPPPGSPSGPNAYTAMFGGDGGFAAADSQNPNFVFGEYVYLQIHRSIDGGERAAYIHHGITEAAQGGALFIAPFILDPVNPETMYAGGRSLWRTQNVRSATPSWKSIKKPLAAEGGRPVFVSAIEARAIDPGQAVSGIVWVGHTNGQIFRSTNGAAETPDWHRMDNAGTPTLPRRYVNRVRVLSSDPSTIYVAFAGFNKDNIWRSRDAGATWTAISASLPEVSVYDVATHPRNPLLLYAATEVGVFASGDGGESWWPTNQGPANVAVMELLWSQERLIAASHGRGIFWIDLSEGVAEAYVVSSAQPAGTSTRSAAPATAPAAVAPAAPAAAPAQIVPISPLTTR